MKTQEIFIHGKVQGVWFRKNAKGQALKLGLFGWVKNLNDGTVQIMAQGDLEALDLFLKWCNIGSPKSRVDKFDELDVASEAHFEGFVIIK